LTTIEQAFEDIRQASYDHDDILGFVVTGSRGKGFANQWSDYDFAIFVADSALAHYEQAYRDLPPGGRLYILTLDGFRRRVAWQGPRDWERYTWAHLTVENDRTGGEIQKLLDETGHVPPEYAETHIRGSLRYFFNQVYHSIKNLRNGNVIGHRLEAAAGIRPFLEAVFCAHNRRLVPYYKYLRWELETWPLTKLNQSADELLPCLMRVLGTGDYRAQQTLLAEAKRLFTDEGWGPFFDTKYVKESLAFRC